MRVPDNSAAIIFLSSVLGLIAIILLFFAFPLPRSVPAQNTMFSFVSTRGPFAAIGSGPSVQAGEPIDTIAAGGTFTWINDLSVADNVRGCVRLIFAMVPDGQVFRSTDRCTLNQRRHGLKTVGFAVPLEATPGEYELRRMFMFRHVGETTVMTVEFPAIPITVTAPAPAGTVQQPNATGGIGIGK